MNQVTDNLKQRATLSALKQLFDPGKWFNICIVDDLQKVWGFTIPASTYATLRLMHCVHYSQMPDGTREDLARIVVGLVRDAAADIGVEIDPFAKPQSEERKVSLFRRLVR